MARRYFAIGLMLGLVVMLSAGRTAAQAPVQPELPAARTWFVSPTGSGSACTQAAPCFWVSPSSTSSGDTIILKGGLYYGNTLLTITHPVWIKGSWTGNSSGAPIFDRVNSETRITGFGPSQVARINYNPGTSPGEVMLESLTLSGGEATAAATGNGSGGCVDLERGRLYLLFVKIKECKAESYGGGVYVESAHDHKDTFIQIYNAAFSYNTATYGGGAVSIGWDVTGYIGESSFYADQASYGSAINLDRNSVAITGNFFSYHGGSSTLMLSGDQYHDLDVHNNIVLGSSGVVANIYGYDPVWMYHNTFYGNSTSVLSTSGDTAYVLFRNNIVAYSGYNADVLVEYGQSEIAANKNIYWGNPHQTLVGSNPIYQDPKLGVGYHLTYPSPAINAGLTNLNVFYDYDGQTRDAKPDIGADEFVAKVFLPAVHK
jgi:hypothetical protein